MDLMIGERIKNRRKELHLTGKQIKDAVGISTGNLSDIENGKILPSSSALIGLSKVLECSCDYILLGKSHISESSSLICETPNVFFWNNLETCQTMIKRKF